MDFQARNVVYIVSLLTQFVFGQKYEHISNINGICHTRYTAMGKLCNCSNRLFHIIPKDVPSDCSILDLSRNQLSTLERNHFARFVDLKELYLSANTIQAIHPHAFDVLSNLTVLDLASNMLQVLPPRVFTDTKLLRVLNLVDNNLKLPPHIGHLTHLQELTLSKNSLSFVTKTMWAGSPTLRVLNISSNHIIELHSESFEGLTSLETLDISHNDINTIGNGAFLGLTRLDVLRLQNNQLTNVGIDAFQDLVMLTALHMENNQLSVIPLGLQNGIRNLKALYLQENKIVELPVGYFKFMPNLATLNLNKNWLKVIAGGSFTHLVQLTSLDLQHNQLDSLPSDVFIGLSMLKILDLRKNRLGHIENILRPLKNLETVLLSDNLISDIPEGTFDQCIRIIEVRINHNNLTTIPQGIGRSVTVSQTLKGLSLADNPIKQVTATSFGRFSSLQLLRLSNSQLRSIPIGTFNQMPRLIELWLDGNQLTTVAKGTLVPLPRLKSIHLQGNMWRCQCGLRDFWSYLNSQSISYETEAKPVCHSPPEFAGQTLEATFNKKDCVDDDSSLKVMEVDLLIPIIVGSIVIIFIIIAFICVAASPRNPLYSKEISPSVGYSGRAMSMPYFASRESASSSTPLTLPPRNSSRYKHQMSTLQPRMLHTSSNLDRQGSYLSINVPVPGGEYAHPYAQPYSPSPPKNNPSFHNQHESHLKEDIY